MSTPMVQADGVTKRFGPAIALQDVSLRIDSGELFALIGPDGAGKTTFFRLVAGLLSPDAGRMTRAGGHTFGLVPQQFSLYQDLTVDENLWLRARLHGVPAPIAAARMRDLLERVDLADVRNRLAGALSGGMKQKLALVAALLTEPALLLLDEPTTGVDPVSRRELWILLNRLHHDGLTLIASTPYMDEAEYATRIAFLDAGRVIASGTPDELIAAYPRALVEVQTPARVEVRRRLASLPAVEDVSVFGTRLHVRGRNADAAGLRDAVAAHLSGVVDGAAVRPIPAGLEDVFVWQGAAGGHDG
jgi:ABC-2 type transport system ATP-binding protein